MNNEYLEGLAQQALENEGADAYMGITEPAVLAAFLDSRRDLWVTEGADSAWYIPDPAAFQSALADWNAAL